MAYENPFDWFDCPERTFSRVALHTYVEIYGTAVRSL
jgi:hypothetical protein